MKEALKKIIRVVAELINSDTEKKNLTVTHKTTEKTL